MTSNFTHPAFKLVREDISNLDAIERVATQLCRPQTLAEDPVFLAYCELPNLGPANDYDGVRSAAIALKCEWEAAVLFPAQIVRSMGLF
jgi:hypothetical protein